MNADDLEEIRYRKVLNLLLGGFVARRTTIEMTLPGLMLLFPYGDQALETICETHLTGMLQDLAVEPDRLEHTVAEILDMVLDEVRHQARMVDLSMAIAALEARGHTVTQINVLGRYHIDGAGDFSVDDLLDLAEQ